MSVSGATEHLTNSKIIFKLFDPTDQGFIKCANDSEFDNLSTQGAGTIQFKLKKWGNNRIA